MLRAAAVIKPQTGSVSATLLAEEVCSRPRRRAMWSCERSACQVSKLHVRGRPQCKPHSSPRLRAAWLARLLPSAVTASRTPILGRAVSGRSMTLAIGWPQLCFEYPKWIDGGMPLLAEVVQNSIGAPKSTVALAWWASGQAGRIG